MTEPRYAHLMARVLRSLPTPEHQPTTPQEARGILEMERALVVRRQRVRLRVLVGVGSAVIAAAAAAALLIGRGAFTEHQGLEASAHATMAPVQPIAVFAQPRGVGVALRVLGHEEPLSGAAELAVGSQILAGPAGGAIVDLSTGTRMTLGNSTDFAVQGRGPLQQFQLVQGLLHAKVAKLHRDQRFIVSTPDAEIEVRGTEFDLSVVEHAADGCEGSRTLLRVAEGVVEVRAQGSKQRIRAGEQWPASCSQPATHSTALPASPTPSPTAAGGVNLGAHVSSRAVALEAAVEVPPAASPAEVARNSHLIEQNDLFARGVAARRSGDTQGALAAYADLIARFPQSPLAENAMVERMHLLKKSAPAQATREAQQYLQLFPSGFAHAEATELLEGAGANKGEQ